MVLLLTCCGSSGSHISSSAGATTTTTPPGCPPIVTTTSVPEPAGSRLVHPWAVPNYNAGSPALADFRMEPAPSTTTPHLTRAQAVAAARTGPAMAGLTPQSDISVRFGLFFGNVANVGTDANHTLQGNTALSGIPAWIVAAYGVTSSDLGGPAPLGGTDASASTIAPCPKQQADAVVVISDADGKELANLQAGNFDTLD